MSIRDSQDIELAISQPSPKVRDSQDIEMVVLSPARTSRISQDVILVIKQKSTSNPQFFVSSVVT